MTADVTLAGVFMHGSSSTPDAPDADGVVWNVSDLAGWDAAPERINAGDLTGKHGGFGSSSLYASRQLTLSGWCDCPSQAAAFGVRDRLHALRSGDLVVHEPTAKVLEVVSGGGVRSDWPLEGPSPVVQWQIRLTAPDPFKHALTPTTTIVGPGASVAAANAGTAAADLVVTLSTAGTVVLSAGGVTLTTQSLPSGAVIDTGAATVKDSTGGDLFHLVTLPALWPALPAGGGMVTQAGTAALSIEHFDTYA